MKKTIKKAFIIIGIFLLASAASLCIYNIVQDRSASRRSQEVLTELRKLIPVSTAAEITKPAYNPADDIYTPYEEEKSSVSDIPEPINIDGRRYCGLISIPALGLELPVSDDCSYDELNMTPCRYSGTAAGNDLMIAAHNYNGHFGRIGELNSGDELLFFDTGGKLYTYRVDDIRIFDGSDSEGMFSGKSSDWDITLFTCTLSGRSRVAVRGCKTE